MTKRKRRPKPTPARTYAEALRDEIVAIANTRPDLFPHAASAPARAGIPTVRLSLSTAHMPSLAGGMAADEVEHVVVLILDDPDVPPVVIVEHGRFLGVPHVLTNGELCIYLDASREWDPAHGAVGFLNRLHDWFMDAIANRFDASTALHHAVGGRAHTSADTPLVVCPFELPDKELGFVRLATVTHARIDLGRDHDEESTDDRSERVLVVRAPGPLFAGPGATVKEVFGNLGTELAGKALHAWAQRIARLRRDGHEFAHIVLTVPNPGVTPYVLVARLRIAALDQTASAHDVARLPLEWCRLDDQRPSISTRRDANRPVRAYQGRDIALIGCGGLGSWIAEFLARAGAGSIALLDPASVKGGLLVRQNFTDDDVGVDKDEALARRVRAIAPECKVTTGADAVARLTEVLASDTCLVIDATISLAFGRRLDAISADVNRKALAARVATDIRSGSLGMVVVSDTAAQSLDALDIAAKTAVTCDGTLEPYHTFWEAAEDDEMIPAKGCSIPTFHGSAADMAAVSAEIVNLIAGHLGTRVSGVHLFALPHSGANPAHAFLPPDRLGLTS